MNKLFFLLIVPFFCFGSESSIFRSSCGGAEYKIESFCKVNNLNNDQDKLDIPICEKQILFLGGNNIDLARLTGIVERTNNSGKQIKMMGFVFYGSSCKNDKIILSGSGGCNSCGEIFKTFNLSGKEIKEKTGNIDLEPMQDVIPNMYGAE